MTNLLKYIMVIWVQGKVVEWMTRMVSNQEGDAEDGLIKTSVFYVADMDIGGAIVHATWKGTTQGREEKPPLRVSTLKCLHSLVWYMIP